MPREPGRRRTLRPQLASIEAFSPGRLVIPPPFAERILLLGPGHLMIRHEVGGARFATTWDRADLETAMKWMFASLALLLTGCPPASDSTSSDATDAPDPTDSTDSIDATNTSDTADSATPTPTPQVGTVTVHITGDSIDDEVRLMVADVDGAWVRTHVTDQPLVQLEKVPVGGSVTLVGTVGSEFRLYTVFGVQDGDTVFPGGPLPTGRLGDALVEVSNPDVGAPRFRALIGGCIVLSGPVPLSTDVELDDRCLNEQGGVDAAASVGTPGEGSVALALVENAALTGTPPNQVAEVRFTDWKLDPGYVEATLESTTDQGWMSLLVHGVRDDRWYLQQRADGLVTAENGLTVRLPVDAAFHDRAVARWEQFDETGQQVRTRTAWFDALPADGAVGRMTVSADDLPASITAPTWDADRGAVSLSVPDDLCAGVASSHVSMELSRPAKEGTHRWTLHGPVETGGRLPHIDPDLVAEVWPAAADVSVEWLTVAALSGGWEALRQTPYLNWPGRWSWIEEMGDTTCWVDWSMGEF